MPSKPYYPWYPADFWMKTQHLKVDERGFYRDFLDHCWIHGGSLSKEKFRNIEKFSPKKFEKYWKKIEEFLIFSEKINEFSTKKTLKILDSVIEKSIKNTENANKRWGNVKKINANALLDNASQSHLFIDANQSQRENQSQTPNKKIVKDPAKSRKPNIYWDITCELFKQNPVTKTELGRIGKAAKEFKQKIPDGVDVKLAIEGTIKKYKKAHEGFSVTPEAILKHWDTLNNSDEHLTLEQKTEIRFGTKSK